MTMTMTTPNPNQKPLQFLARPRIESLCFRQMSFQYNQSSEIFSDVSFDLPLEQYVWIKSNEVGTGRSTLLQILAGLLPITGGEYLVNGKNVANMSFEQFLPFRLAIGYSFDFGGLLHNRTLFDNLALPLLYHNLCSPKEAEDRIHHYMQEMGIFKYKNQKPSSVQGSVRKIVCLLRPLLLQPQVLLLDDPAMGLSQDMAKQYVKLIEDLRTGGFTRHIFISTFDQNLMGLFPHLDIFIDRSEWQVVGCPVHLKKAGSE